MAALRERVERQRSVGSNNTLPGSQSDLLEGLNLERGKDTNISKLDDQVSNLHQDVAQLSVEVYENKLIFLNIP